MEEILYRITIVPMYSKQYLTSLYKRLNCFEMKRI